MFNGKDIDFKTSDTSLRYHKYIQSHDCLPEDAAFDRLFLYSKLRESDIAKLPDAFTGVGRALFISLEFRDLLLSFDLGCTQMFELPLYEYDRETLRKERWVLLHVCEKKDAVVVEESDFETRFRNPPLTPNNPESGSFALRSSALDGVDLWWDTKIGERLFFSDRLRQAIRKHRIRANRWHFRECRILE